MTTRESNEAEGESDKEKRERKWGETAEMFYAKKTSSLPFEVKFISPATGKGVFAKRDLKEGEVILSEKPFLFAPDPSNKKIVQTCDNCMKFIGRMKDQVTLLAGYRNNSHNHKDKESDKELNVDQEKEKKEQQFPQVFNHLLSSTFPCASVIYKKGSNPRKCRSQYCSEECAVESFRRFHCLVCSDLPHPVYGKHLQTDSGKDAAGLWDEFVEFASESNTNFILAGKLIGSVMMTADKIGLDAALFPVHLFWKKPWWEVATPPDEMTSKMYDMWQLELKTQLSDALKLLKNVFYKPEYDQLFAFDFFAEVVGMLEMNCLDICIPSPVNDFIYDLMNLAPQAMSSNNGASGTLTLPVEVKDKLDIQKDGSSSVLCFCNTILNDISQRLRETKSKEVSSPHGEVVEIIEIIEIPEGLSVDQVTEDMLEIVDIQYITQTQESSPSRSPSVTSKSRKGSEEIEFPTSSGTGLYTLHSSINHSCCPNAGVFQVETEEGNRAVVKMLKDVMQGEEVVVSYLDEQKGFHARQKVLNRTYAFVCACSKCLFEKKPTLG